MKRIKAKLILLMIGILAGLAFSFGSNFNDPTKRIFVPTTTAFTTLCIKPVTAITTLDNGTPGSSIWAQTTSTLPCTWLTGYTTNKL